MSAERYVLLGVARARAEWFRRVGQWATAAVIPAEFLRCLSAAEVRARLASGRRFSAVLVDAGLGEVDRDLVAAARQAGVPVLVVGDATARTWLEVGAAAVLPEDLDREDLLEALAAHAATVGVAAVAEEVPAGEPAATRRGDLVVVTGTGGTGASTVAIALAQGLAAGEPARDVLLADLCRNADQAMLHDSRVVVPSVQEVVEAHRAGTPRPDDVRAQTFRVQERGYRLLLGLRRPRHWVAIRAQAFDATLETLQRTFDTVVCDVEPDLEGEAETGSLDVEDRHLMARAACVRAGAVVVVGAPGMKGLHALVRVLGDLVSLGVPAERLVPVVSPAPRSPRERADITTSLAALTRSSLAGAAERLASPTHLPTRKVDLALRDGVAIPRPLPELLVGAVRAVLARDGAPATTDGPRRVRPGSLGLFTS